MIKNLFRSIFFFKTRQNLLLISMVGLALSSLSLLILQSTMGGLQHNLIDKSKKASGFGVINFTALDEDERKDLEKKFEENDVKGYFELEMEMLLRQGNYISPVIVHGLTNKIVPHFLHDYSLNGAIVGADLFYKLRMDIDAPLVLISPAHTNPMFQDVPRYVTTYAQDLISTKVPEVDLFHLWVDAKYLQNLIRERVYNRFVLNDHYNQDKVSEIIKQRVDAKLFSWEEKHQDLVFALGLENTVMTFLFIIMTFLVAICITSGQIIYYESQKIDYIGLWILGKSLKDLSKTAEKLMYLVSLCSILFGLIVGTILLFIIDKYSAFIMPEVFVERKIPVDFNFISYLTSFLVPFIISWCFTRFSLKSFKLQSKNFLNDVRSLS